MSDSHPLERMGAKLDEYIEALDRLVKGDVQPSAPEPLNLNDTPDSLEPGDYDAAVALLAETEEVIALIESRMTSIRDSLRKVPHTSRRDSASLFDKRV